MDLHQALELFRSFDEQRVTEYHGDQGTYNVRLDATALHETGDRTYRVRVTPGDLGVGRDEWLFVAEEAARVGVELDIQNSGVELS